MSYNIVRSKKIVDAGDMSANITSPAVEIIYQDDVGIQLNWTGVPVGVFSVEISNDHVEDRVGNIVTAGNWIALPLLPAVQAVGAADSAFIEIHTTSASYIRVKYTKTSGSGSLDAFVAAKGI